VASNRFGLRMVARQIAACGVRDPRVLQAVHEGPREEFVAPDFAEFAYEDSPRPIAERQTISQPYSVALMIEDAEVGSGDKVLEIGTARATPTMSWAGSRTRSIQPGVTRVLRKRPCAVSPAPLPRYQGAWRRRFLGSPDAGRSTPSS
jgi:hypothetical protein